MNVRIPFMRKAFAAPGLLAWAFVVLVPAAAEAATWYVATTGSDAGAGTAVSPFATIQHGLDVAVAGDEVLVMAGTYTGPGNRALDTGGKAVTVRGLSGAAATIIDCEGLYDGFSLSLDEEDTTTVIADFTIADPVVGCDLLLAAPRLRNLVVSGATTAGVRFDWAEFKAPATPLVVEDCAFAGNVLGLRSWMPTGREYCQVRRCTFSGNTTAVMGIVTMYGCTVSGGGVGVMSTPQVSNQLVAGCEFSGIAGTVFAPDPEDAAVLEVVGTVVHDNPGLVVFARSIEAEYLTLTFSGCEIVDNGGGIDVGGNFVDVVIDGCLYARNGAPIAYAGAFAAGGSFACLNSTVADNAATGLLLSSEGATLEVGNTIVAYNTGWGIDVPTAAAGYDIHCCDVFGSGSGGYGTIPDQTGSNGNIAADPQFCDRPGGDYSLDAASPCTAANSACGRIGREDEGCGWPERTWYVATDGDDGNPGTLAGPFASIGRGVDAAAAGDTVYVLDGVYVEHVAVTKPLRLASLSGDTTACTIVAPPGWRVVTVTDAADTVRIEGFELTGGRPAQGDTDGFDLGGGVLAKVTPLVISDCHIHDNVVPADQTHSAGGAVHVRQGSYLRLVRCRIDGNDAPRAGGVCIRHSAGADLYGNVIVDNTAVLNAAAVWLLPNNPAAPPYRLVGNTIAGNVLAGAGEAVSCNLLLDLTLDRNIIAWNACAGGQLGLWGSQVAMACNVVHPEPRYAADTAYDDAANLHADPWFCNRAARDYFLAATSPAAPDASYCGLIGALGVGCAIPSGVDDGPPVPAAGRVVLHAAWPNPFNPHTTIAYELPRAAAVDLAIYAVDGRRVRTLRAGEVEGPGRTEAVWRGRDDAGRALAAGAYVCRLEAAGQVATTKLLLLK